jgi:hypothetical protein
MSLLEKIKKTFNSSDFTLTDFVVEKESKEYEGCNFKLNDLKIYFRKAKITPKKEGQFVTFYKRIQSGIIAPFDDEDDFQFLIVNVEFENQRGYFILPKLLLAQKNILTTSIKDGKRAFRIYSPWDEPKNKQALTSQQWQLDSFTAASDLQNYLLERNLF